MIIIVVIIMGITVTRVVTIAATS